ncbi:MAG: iron ABC transporter permease [Chloroflexi bacterium]|nr:iron ABC transporter permease [Chloroflexota bacterium]MCC6895286.1 iron ABC transporter permease [Anaerolineae bacterium]
MRRSLSATRNKWLAVLALGLVGAFILSLALGSVNIPVSDVLTILTGGIPARATWTTIVLDFRLPKALTALLAGAALGVSGLQMQTLFRNPLADPFVLGVSSGASLGVALVVLGVGTTGAVLLAGLGLTGDLGLTVAAFLGAALTLMIVVSVAARVQSVMTLLILGLMFGYVTSAVVTLLLYFSITERIKAYMSWTFGSFAAVTWGQMPIFIPVILVSIVIAFLLSKPLNALLLGEGYARSMGMNVRRGRLLIIASTALLAGTVTAFCGPIGFLGLAVPHLCRALLGTSDHRALIPATVLMGGILALVADMIAQMPGNQTVLPLNAVTSLIGAPVVIWVILRRRNLRQTFSG